MKALSTLLTLLVAAGFVSSSLAQTKDTLPPVYIVPNFHPASCGWLANWSVERNYCANSYLRHMDRVGDDSNYNFGLSECNNMIAIQNFVPERFEELKKRVKEGRVELVNAFFLEPTVSLSGGEALARMGIEGLRWQQQVMGVRPRFCWAIDTCGMHEQMPQIVAKLGLEALVYCRNNPTTKTLFYSESPDGTRIPTLVPGQYSDWSKDGVSMVFGEKNSFTQQQLANLKNYFAKKAPPTPKGAPILVLGGKGDYSLPPARKENPTELLDQWKAFAPDTSLKFSTLSSFYDKLSLDQLDLPKVRGGTRYTWSAFWVQNHRVKSWYRRDEHALQAAETMATIASLKAGYDYPAQLLNHAWLLMLLNMDRNTLWGAAGGMVFEDANSWDAKDRFEWVETNAARVTSDASRKLAGGDGATLLFNPLNWERHDPVDGSHEASLPSVGIGPAAVSVEAKEIALPERIDTKFYSATLDAKTGAIVSLKLKPSGREILGGPANVLVAEKGLTGHSEAGDNLFERAQRPRIATSGDSESKMRVTENAVAISVEITGKLIGETPCRRVVRFNKNYPRIDFETELNDIPDRTVVVAEFPLVEAPTEIRRGIPFGFSHGAWPKPTEALPGWTSGILPAVRWSDYTLPGGGGIALLDRGLPGREITDKTPTILLFNAVEKYYGYPNAWLSGKGRHRLEYALAVRDTDWKEARIPQMAWEYNCPPIKVQGKETAPQSFLNTSSNVIVEVMRRDGADIELRLAEALGFSGNAEVTLNLPHKGAALTDLAGANAQPLKGGPSYSFAVKPQQIVTLRFRTETSVGNIKPLMDWTELVPPAKQPALKKYLEEVVGHPPRGK